MTAIMGVNGSGKSTILHALSCVYQPYKSGADRPKRDAYFIGLETCIPEIEKERQTSYIDYKTSLANDKTSRKIIEEAAYILNKDYAELNYHSTKKKELLGVHMRDGMGYSFLSMGAGEQRVLKILRTVFSAQTYSLILIDEIDVLLHVTALKRLICQLSKITKERNLQIIFTTHSIEMSDMQDMVDIRYLEPLEEKTMVYDTITPDIVHELNENKKNLIEIYVEDLLTETVVQVVADDLGISRNIKVIKIGAASNAFVLATSFILQAKNTDNILILLDGDVYRTKEDKTNAIKKVLSGTEKEHEEKVNQAVSVIRQLVLPEKTEPEKYIHKMLIEMNDKKEIVQRAKKIKAVSNSHEWLDILIKEMGQNDDITMHKIIEMVSENTAWATYIRELREWLMDRKKNLKL